MAHFVGSDVVTYNFILDFLLWNTQHAKREILYIQGENCPSNWKIQIQIRAIQLLDNFDE